MPNSRIITPRSRVEEWKYSLSSQLGADVWSLPLACRFATPYPLEVPQSRSGLCGDLKESKDMGKRPHKGLLGVGSIPAAARFSEKQWVWDGVHSAS
jgi:hypothetical protein